MAKSGHPSQECAPLAAANVRAIGEASPPLGFPPASQSRP